MPCAFGNLPVVVAQGSDIAIVGPVEELLARPLGLALIESGTVWVNTHDMIDANTPFGGVKRSGVGKDLGPEQLDHFMETKAVWVAL
jgi:acyl-CoA reductase-like NAD-dependent aldehyde dehydrogenase